MNTKHPLSALTSHCARGDVGDALYLDRALAFDFSGDGPTAPEWVQVFPSGPDLAAVDGRSWKMSDPEAFVAAQDVSAGRPILVDYDHLSSFMPDEGGDQTAAGWIEELEVRNGEVWARVTWTVRARRQIEEGEWRYISPEFRAHKKTGEVALLDAVSLVNRPAFEMKALARAGVKKNGDTTMLKAIAKALGLSDDATEDQILAAISKKDAELATAKASEKTPSTKDFMPRRDYDTVLARATAAEAKLKEQADEVRAGEIETMIATAVADGKIAPASKDHYVNLASASDEGFDEVKKLTETLPSITASVDLDERELKAGGRLTDDEKEMCAQLGVTEDDFLKQRAAEQAR